MAVPIVAVGCGGVLKEGGKTDGSVRSVPLRKVVMDALDAMPPRIDSPILFPAPRRGHIDAEKFRHREWTPALRASGVPHRRLYDVAIPSPPGRAVSSSGTSLE